MKKALLGLLLAAASAGVSANGYWDYRTVCDYETVTTQTPYTSCSYSGWLNGFGAGSVPSSSYFTLGGHTSCPSSDYKHVYQGYWDGGQYKFAWFSGHLHLTSQNHSYHTKTERRRVEGSCRTERVWVELCDGCQIP